MKKRNLLRAMSLIFALLLVASSAIVVVPFATSAADTDAAWAADANGVFTINTVDDLYAFANTAEANGWYAGKTVKLGVNIDLDGEPAWTPVAQFKGTFDGNGKTIKNLTLNATTANVAFIKVLDGATIKNFRLEGNLTQTAGNAMVAVLAVETKGAASTIENVYVGGTISTEKSNTNAFRVGGFLAFAVADVTIKNSVSAVNIVKGFKSNAGFVGATKMGSTVNLTDCAFIGFIDAGVNVESGAFVGRLGGNLNMTRCLKLGFSDDQTGQYAGTFVYLDCKDFELNNNTAPTGWVAPTINITDCYTTQAADGVIVVGGHGGRSTNLYNINIKYGTETVYTYAVAEGNTVVVHTDSSAAVKLLANKDGATLTKDNFATTCPGFTAWTVTDDTLVYNNKADAEAKTVPVAIPTAANIKADTFVKGETTFKVSTADELIAVAAKIASKGNFVGKTIELQADIDMTGKTWTMVDTFSGVLDGNGFAIKNLTMNETTDNVAMFKVLDGATIKNLTIVDATMTVTKADSKGMIAILATETSGAAVNIENVYIGGTMTLPTNTASYRHAGFVAYSKTETNIKNCMSEINMTAVYKANSGFVGAVKYGTTLNMTDCVFAGHFVDTVNAETGAFVGRVGGNVNLTRCVKLGYCKDQSGQYNGAFMYLDQNDFDLGNTIPENWVAPTIVIEDCYASLHASGQNIVGGHGTRSTGKYNVVVKYAGETVYNYVAEGNTATIHTVVTPTIKTVATGGDVFLTKDTFSTDFTTLSKSGWVITDKTVKYQKDTVAEGVVTAEGKTVIEIMPETLAALLKREITGRYEVKATENWAADANGVFNIATAGDMLAFSANAEANGWYNGKAVQLTADIDMDQIDFVPVAKFMGYFEGNGHQIQNLTVKQAVEPLGGLIVIGDGMTMKNVMFVGGTITMDRAEQGGSMLGGVVGQTAGNFDCTFENIYVGLNLVAPVNNTSFRVGGLIGDVAANSTSEESVVAKVTIKNCVSDVIVVTSYKSAAGFVGSNAFGTLVDMTDCVFTGKFLTTGAENGGFLGRIVGSVNLTRCFNLGAINQSGNRYSGALGYLDNKDFVLDNTFTIASMIPSEINIVDCYAVLAKDATLQNVIGAHDTRRAYKVTISYTGDAAPVYTNATVEQYLVDYVAASDAVKKLAVEKNVTLTKDNFATVCPGFTNWTVLDGATISYGTDMSIVAVIPTSVASMMNGTFVAGSIPTDLPVWKLPDPVEETTTAEQVTDPIDDETTAAPGDETTAKADDETTGTTEPAKKKGCKSVVGGSIALIVAIAGGAMLLNRKKED